MYNEELLLQLFLKHNGNIEQLWGDIKKNKVGDVPQSRNKLYDVTKQKSFSVALDAKREKIAKKAEELATVTKKQIISLVTMGIKKYAKTIALRDKISTYEFEILWRILKTELGEPIVITKNENINHDFFDEIAEVISPFSEEEKKETESELLEVLKKNPLEEEMGKEESATNQPE